MPDLPMTELRERLQVLGDRGPTRGADDVFNAACTALETDPAVGAAQQPARRIVAVALAVAVVVALTVSGVVWLRDEGADPAVRLTPASSDLHDLYDTSDQASLGDPLYLIPGYVPDGLEVFRVQGGDEPGVARGWGGSVGTTRAQTFIKFDSEGTRPVGMFQVQWGAGDTAAAGLYPGTDRVASGDPLGGYRLQSVPDRVRGRDALYAASLNSLAWEEPEGQMVAVSSSSFGGEQLTVDALHAIAESLDPREGGGFTVGDIPSGYLLVAEVPGMASFGTNTREVVYRGDDGRAFRVQLVDDTEMGPGINLIAAPAISGERDPHLVEVRGHHAVATRELMSGGGFDQQTLFLQGANQHVQWLEPANVMVTVSGLGLTEQELLAVANGLHVVDRSGWEQLLVQAPGLVGGPPELPAVDPVLEGEEKAAADAFVRWISPGDLEELITRIEDGEALRDVIAESQTRVDPAATYEGRVHTVRLVDPDHALVTFSLIQNGSAVLANQQGSAVRVDGRWLVSRATYCAIMALGGTECPVA